MVIFKIPGHGYGRPLVINGFTVIVCVFLLDDIAGKTVLCGNGIMASQVIIELLLDDA